MAASEYHPADDQPARAGQQPRAGLQVESEGACHVELGRAQPPRLPRAARPRPRQAPWPAACPAVPRPDAGRRPPKAASVITAARTAAATPCTSVALRNNATSLRRTVMPPHGEGQQHKPAEGIADQPCHRHGQARRSRGRWAARTCRSGPSAQTPWRSPRPDRRRRTAYPFRRRAAPGRPLARRRGAAPILAGDAHDRASGGSCRAVRRPMMRCRHSRTRRWRNSAPNRQRSRHCRESRPGCAAP